jgi:asparagine synthase (glutamine-hydrolysing)
LPAHDELAWGLTAQQRSTLQALVADQEPLPAVSALELSSYIRERLMRDADASSMAASLELRVPFLDHVVVEDVAGLTEADRFLPVGRKQFLRNASLPRVDPALFERPKAGFVLPIDGWCRRGMRKQMDDTFHDVALCDRIGLNPTAAAALWRSFLADAPGLYWSRVWAIFVLLDWCGRHRVGL